MKQRQIFTSILLALLVMTIDVLPVGAQSTQASEVVMLVNALRASKGLPDYRVDATLTAVAQAQAEWSAANNHIGHDGPGGNRPRDRAILGGYGGGKSISAQENVAQGTLPYVTADWVVTMWQGDDIHLGALLSTRHDDIGVGYAEANGNAWYVMMIGRVGSGNMAPTKQPEPRQESPVSDAPSTMPVVVPVVPARLGTPGPDGSIWHEVQIGQTAWTVAALYGIDLSELFGLNNLTENSILRPGDRLLVHPPLATASPTLTEMPGAFPTAVQVAVQAPTPVSSPTLPARKDRTYDTDSPSLVIWGLLVTATVVLAGSGARAAYILRQWKKGKSGEE